MSEDFVPVIDISGRTAGIVREIANACETSGFFTVVGHGIRTNALERMLRTTSDFFNQSESEKSQSANSGSGVSGLRRPDASYEAFAAHVTGDLSEAERGKLGSYPATWKVANIWPNEEFKREWHGYMESMTQLSAKLMRFFALALDLEGDFFAPKFDRHVSLLLANHYYPQPAPDKLRREAHTDWGSLTVLYVADEASGLQVRRGENEWLDVASIPGSFVVNIGDLMAFWTGGRWASTVHRVVNPDEQDAPARISIPFFYLPNHDAPIEPMRPLTGDTTGARMERVTVGQWFSHKMQETYRASSFCSGGGAGRGSPAGTPCLVFPGQTRRRWHSPWTTGTH